MKWKLMAEEDDVTVWYLAGKRATSPLRVHAHIYDDHDGTFRWYSWLDISVIEKGVTDSLESAKQAVAATDKEENES